MGNLIYLIVTVLMNSWVIGFLGYKAGNFIHVLLLVAIAIITTRIIKERVPKALTKIISRISVVEAQKVGIL